LPTDGQPGALILIENDVFPADLRVLDEARSLRDHGYHVTVISPTGRKRGTTFYESIEGIEVYRFRLPDNLSGVSGFVVEYLLAAAKLLWLSLRVLRMDRFDVVQICNPPDIFFLHGLLYKALGKAFIFDQHDLAPELFWARYGKKLPLLLKAVYLSEKLTYKVADAVLVENDSVRDAAIRRGGIDPNRVFVVRNGPNKQRMHIVPADPSLKRGRSHLVTFEGLMGPQDGVDLAVRAAHWIVQSGRTDVTFAFCGDGEELEPLKALAEELGISEYVDFAGFVDSETLVRYLCSSDVGLTPDPLNGYNEFSTAVKVMEYMAVGLPIVAFDLRETHVSAQDAAVYAEPNDYAAFGKLVLDLLDDPAKRERMGEIGRQRIEDVLSWKNSEPHLLSAYQSAIARRSPVRAGTSVRNELPAQEQLG